MPNHSECTDKKHIIDLIHFVWQSLKNESEPFMRKWKKALLLSAVRSFQDGSLYSCETYLQLALDANSAADGAAKHSDLIHQRAEEI